MYIHQKHLLVQSHASLISIIHNKAYQKALSQFLHVSFIVTSKLKFLSNINSLMKQTLIICKTMDLPSLHSVLWYNIHNCMQEMFMDETVVKQSHKDSIWRLLSWTTASGRAGGTDSGRSTPWGGRGARGKGRRKGGGSNWTKTVVVHKCFGHILAKFQIWESDQGNETLPPTFSSTFSSRIGTECILVYTNIHLVAWAMRVHKQTSNALRWIVLN